MVVRESHIGVEQAITGIDNKYTPEKMWIEKYTESHTSEITWKMVPIKRLF